RLAAAELAGARFHHQWAPAELGDAGGEGDAGAGGGLVEQDRDGAGTGEGPTGEAVAGELEGEGEDLLLLGRGEIVIAQEVAGHLSSLPPRAERRTGPPPHPAGRAGRR